MKSTFLTGFAAVVLISCSNVSGSGPGSAAPGGTVSSGGDMFYEYDSHTTSSTMNMNGSSKVYLAADGKMRKETQLVNSAKPDKSAPIVAIGSADKPMESIVIDDDSKTWSVNHLDSADLDNKAIHMTSTVSKLDNEKILGFDCVHVRVISNKDIGGLIKELDTMDIWKSKDVPVPSVFGSMMSRIESGTGFMYAKDVPAQLKQMGCDGFLVKMQIRSKDIFTVMELTKAEKRDLPKSLFAIPAGYKEDKSAGF
jgi:Domain of unknown function (DUF4412)